MGVSSKRQRKASVWFKFTLYLSCFVFAMFGAVFKLCFDEYWLPVTLLWTFYWGLGTFLGKVLEEIIKIPDVVSLVELILTAFMMASFAVLGMLYFSEWQRIVLFSVLPFSMSMLWVHTI